MSVFIENMHIVLYVCGALGMMTLVGVLRPESAFQNLFDRPISDDRERLLFRHWSLIAALAGALLIWAAAVPDYRVPILTFALLRKGGIVLMMLREWDFYKTTQGKMVIIVDGVMVVLFAAYLIAA